MKNLEEWITEAGDKEYPCEKCETIACDSWGVCENCLHSGTYKQGAHALLKYLTEMGMEEFSPKDFELEPHLLREGHGGIPYISTPVAAKLANRKYQATIAALKEELAYYKNGTQIKEIHYDEHHSIEAARLEKENARLRAELQKIVYGVSEKGPRVIADEALKKDEALTKGDGE